MQEMLMIGTLNRTLFATVMCSCHSIEHPVEMQFSTNKDGEVEIDVQWPMIVTGWSEETVLRRFWWRIKKAARILFVGHIQMTADFMVNKTNLAAFEEAFRLAKEKAPW